MIKHRCPLTYELIEPEKLYAESGLRRLSPRLKHLAKLPYSPAELRQQAVQRADKMSIAGVQPKISAILEVSKSQFTLVDTDGRYLLKPPLIEYPEVPENEDVTMRLAALMGIEVPLHGLVYNNDDSLTYFCKRFDRSGHTNKLSMEDFAQLTKTKRNVKYQSSMEKVVKVIEEYTTFPVLEKKKLLLRTLFCFLIGNEDMHLKNFSLLTRNNKIELSPAYDLLNTTIVIGTSKEEIALPIRGRKNNLTQADLLQYFAQDCLQLNAGVIDSVLQGLACNLASSLALIEHSFLSDSMKSDYMALLTERAGRLFSSQF